MWSRRISGPWGPTAGSPFGARLCWSVDAATLLGARIEARLVMPGDTGDHCYAWLTQSLFIGEGRVAGDHEIECPISRVD